jgi:radical SAM superfamily enzyme YgiQ (UPF0313 family)
MKILFCIFENSEALGLRILHSIVASKYGTCKLLFINEYNIKLILEAIRDFQPDVLGFSLVSANWDYYKIAYPFIRKAGKFKIILGGWFPTLSPDECKSYCDVVVRGEGERVIIQVLEDIKENKYLREYIGPRADTKNQPFPLLDNNSNRPGYWSSVIENWKLEERDPIFQNYRYGISIGRGCPHSCTYCSNNYMKNLYPNCGKIRFRDYENVFSELLWVKKKLNNLTTIVFFDEIFMPPKEGRAEFFQNYKKAINFPFYALFYPGTCTDEFAKELKQAGLAGVWLGVQSGSERIRKEIFNRYGSNERILKQAQIFSQNNINARYDFIFENPFDTVETLEETRNLIKQLPGPNTINAFRMKFFPNTEITKMALKAGLTDKEDMKRRLSETWRDILNVDLKEVNDLIDKEISEKNES